MLDNIKITLRDYCLNNDINLPCYLDSFDFTDTTRRIWYTSLYIRGIKFFAEGNSKKESQNMVAWKAYNHLLSIAKATPPKPKPFIAPKPNIEDLVTNKHNYILIDFERNEINERMLSRLNAFEILLFVPRYCRNTDIIDLLDQYSNLHIFVAKTDTNGFVCIDIAFTLGELSRLNSINRPDATINYYILTKALFGDVLQQYDINCCTIRSISELFS